MLKWHLSFGSLCVATALAYGFAAIWQQLAEAAASYVYFRFEPEHKSLQVLADGSIIWQTRSPGTFSESRYFDLDGQPVSPAVEEILDNYNWSPIREDTTRSDGGLYLFRDLRSREGFWYLIEAGGGRGYFVGYDTLDNHVLGYIGTDGLQTVPPSQDQMFPFVDGQIGWRSVEGPWIHHGNNPIYPRLRSSALSHGVSIPMVFINSGSDVYFIDLFHREVSILYSDPKIRSIVIVEPGAWETESKYLAVRSSDNLVLIDVESKESKSLPIPADLKDEEQFYWYRLLPGKGYVYWVQHPTEELFYWLDSEGRITDQTAISNELEPSFDSATKQTFVWPIPLYLLGRMLNGYPKQISLDLEIPIGQARANSIQRFRIPLLVVTILSAALATLTAFCSKQFSSDKRSSLLWAAFVLLGGIPAFLGYLTHRTWPAKVGKMELETFTSPPRAKGTELFA